MLKSCGTKWLKTSSGQTGNVSVFGDILRIYSPNRRVINVIAQYPEEGSMSQSELIALRDAIKQLIEVMEALLLLDQMTGHGA